VRYLVRVHIKGRTIDYRHPSRETQLARLSAVLVRWPEAAVTQDYQPVHTARGYNIDDQIIEVNS